MKIEMNQIGYIDSNYKKYDKTPRQSLLNKEIKGKVTVDEAYVEGILGLKENNYIEIIFLFHESTDYSLTTVSRKNSIKSGVFATRSPNRPNFMGISIVKYLK